MALMIDGRLCTIACSPMTRLSLRQTIVLAHGIQYQIWFKQENDQTFTQLQSCGCCFEIGVLEVVDSVLQSLSSDSSLYKLTSLNHDLT